jgi:hypothetical protein
MTSSKIIKLKWRDGSVTTAPDYATALDFVRIEQWSTMNRLQFRFDMVGRAWRWSRTVVNPFCSARSFVRQLERAGFFTVEETSI